MFVINTKGIFITKKLKFPVGYQVKPRGVASKVLTTMLRY